MKKAELVTRVVICVIAVLSIVAVILQIFNEKTDPLETTYEIITFSVAITALIISLMHGLVNARNTRELNRIARETHKAIDEIRDINKDNDILNKKLNTDININKEALEILKEHEKPSR